MNVRCVNTSISGFAVNIWFITIFSAN